MKIALCLHGLFDSLTDSTSKGINGFNYIKKHILDVEDVDVYIHTWNTTSEQKELIEELYSPIKSIYEEPKSFDEIIISRNLNFISGCPRPPHSVLSHLYGVSEVMKLPYETDTQYDLIIKSRFDLGQINRNSSGPGKPNPYPVQCINLLKEIQTNKLYMANWQHFHMGPADMWFYGDPAIMKQFTGLFDFVKENMFIGSPYHTFATGIEGNSGDISNSIAMYKYWMLKTGLWDKKITLDTTWE
jgi:hypothetical protein